MYTVYQLLVRRPSTCTGLRRTAATPNLRQTLTIHRLPETRATCRPRQGTTCKNRPILRAPPSASARAVGYAPAAVLAAAVLAVDDGAAAEYGAQYGPGTFSAPAMKKHEWSLAVLPSHSLQPGIRRISSHPCPRRTFFRFCTTTAAITSTVPGSLIRGVAIYLLAPLLVLQRRRIGGNPRNRAHHHRLAGPRNTSRAGLWEGNRGIPGRLGHTVAISLPRTELMVVLDGLIITA
ncbi:hypothetical protein C8J57DRAFT_117867 [Mycena rebaudengoi]|nr:hypothetical protein C8J57DRAFT_117867 [Mycena rebaudengoi]